MAIKAGQILHVGNDTVVIDRIQTAGATLNIPSEKIYELGNYRSVATIRDVPDLTFTMESLDTSTEIEALLLDVDNGATNEFDLSRARILNLASQFKAGQSAGAPFAVVDSVAIPFLALESVSYRFGLRDNARQTVGLRGDAIFYNPGSTFVDTVAGTGAPGQAIVTGYSAYGTDDGGEFRRVLAVVAGQKRLVLGKDYTETSGAVAGDAAVATITLVDAVPPSDKVRVMYSSPFVRSYPQAVHQGVNVKPAAVRGKDIDVYVGGYDPADVAGSQRNRWGSVQSVAADWRVTLEKDEEFGNYYAVANDFDVPAVTGSMDIKPVDPAELMTRLRTITGVRSRTRAIGANSSVPLPLDVVIKDAADGGRTLKRLHVPDARFTVPGTTGRVQTRTVMTMNYESDEGSLIVYKA